MGYRHGGTPTSQHMASAAQHEPAVPAHANGRRSKLGYRLPVWGSSGCKTAGIWGGWVHLMQLTCLALQFRACFCSSSSLIFFCCMRYSPFVVVSFHWYFYNCFALELLVVYYKNIMKSGEERAADNVLGAWTCFMQLHLFREPSFHNRSMVFGLD